jgi:hypothetical protein
MIKTVVICDVCEGEIPVGHISFRAGITESKFLIIHVPDTRTYEETLDHEAMGHICSLYCTRQALVRYLSKIEESLVRPDRSHPKTGVQFGDGEGSGERG